MTVNQIAAIIVFGMKSCEAKMSMIEIPEAIRGQVDVFKAKIKTQLAYDDCTDYLLRIMEAIEELLTYGEIQ